MHMHYRLCILNVAVDSGCPVIPDHLGQRQGQFGARPAGMTGSALQTHRHREALLTWSSSLVQAEQGLPQVAGLVTPPQGLKPQLPFGYRFPDREFSYSNVSHRHSPLHPTLPGESGKCWLNRKPSQRLATTPICQFGLSSVWTEFSHCSWSGRDQIGATGNLKAANSCSVHMTPSVKLPQRV